jgi:hypothetical protein
LIIRPRNVGRGGFEHYVSRPTDGSDITVTGRDPGKLDRVRARSPAPPSRCPTPVAIQEAQVTDTITMTAPRGHFANAVRNVPLGRVGEPPVA